MSGRTKASPFDVLKPHRIKQLPVSPNAVVVVAGQPVRDVRQIDALVVDDERDDEAVAAARKLADELRKRRRAAREKADRQTPERQAYMESWRQANKPKLAAARKRWVRRNRDKVNAIRRRYYANHAEKHRAEARARYHARKAKLEQQP